MQTGFDPQFGLMRVTPQNQVFPAPSNPHGAAGIPLLELLGLVVGKAMYEGLLLDVALAPLFVMALQRRAPALEDLATLDETLYKSLLQVRPLSPPPSAAPPAFCCIAGCHVDTPLHNPLSRDLHCPLTLQHEQFIGRHRCR